MRLRNADYAQTSAIHRQLEHESPLGTESSGGYRPVKGFLCFFPMGTSHAQRAGVFKQLARQGMLACSGRCSERESWIAAARRVENTTTPLPGLMFPGKSNEEMRDSSGIGRPVALGAVRRDRRFPAALARMFENTIAGNDGRLAAKRSPLSGMTLE